MQLSLSELPTLTEIEYHCLSQKQRKAPGPDGIPSDLCRYGAAALAPQLRSVVCKSFLQGVEPVSYKGGHLCAIFKGKGGQRQHERSGRLQMDYFGRFFRQSHPRLVAETIAAHIAAEENHRPARGFAIATNHYGRPNRPFAQHYWAKPRNFHSNFVH